MLTEGVKEVEGGRGRGYSYFTCHNLHIAAVQTGGQAAILGRVPPSANFY